MDIAKLDKNLSITTTVDRPSLVWLDAAEEPFVTYGAATKNPYLRMPEDAATAASEGVYWLSRNTAGIRVRFRTDSPYIAIHAEWSALYPFSHMPLTGSCGFDLYTEKNGRYFYVNTFVPPADANTGYDSVVDVSDSMQDYILNFPSYCEVSLLYIGVQEGCRFEQPDTYFGTAPVLFYGSSITQGGCASRPGNTYQNMLSRRLNIDYINLGFSGNGKAEQPMADYMAGLELAVFVSDYDHNAPDVDYLRQTHYRLYETIRAAHPDLPYVMVTKPDYDQVDPDYYFTNAQRRAVIMESYIRAVAAGDRNVYFVDGAMLFAGDQADSCTVDHCHPNDLGFYRMYRAMLPTLERILYLPK
ncbi:MAG: SGNH/GDSL hydrolase family protein [Clostridia bacterium]|nr:SGNH/GDSL hydrolase family protein [Clostridia bacterium]